MGEILIEHNDGTSVTVPLAEEAKKIKKVLLKARTVIYGGKRPFAHTAHRAFQKPSRFHLSLL